MSGRDLLTGGVTDIVGLLITVVVCSVDLDPRRLDSAFKVLQKIRSDYAAALEQQTLPLASVQSMLAVGSSSIFSTVVSVQKSCLKLDSDKPKNSIMVQEVDRYNPKEVRKTSYPTHTMEGES